MSRVFVDANVLLEIMFARSKMELVNESLRDPQNEYFVSALSVHIVYYFAEAEKIDRQFATLLANLCGVLSINPETTRLAQERYDGRDFEDCLQAACAEIAKCDEVLTLDKHFAKHSGTKLPVTVL